MRAGVPENALAALPEIWSNAAVSHTQDDVYVRTFAAEFPNDNSELHTGTIWMSEEPCAAPCAHFAADDDDGSDIEIVESFEACETRLEEANVPPPLESGLFAVSEEAPRDETERQEDPYRALLEALAAVAASGVTADDLAATLAEDSVACAWRAILRGESDDFFAARGATLEPLEPLDVWAAELLARLTSAPSKVAIYRRELRARGVAAFGLLAA
jgi:hypothetical protein